MRLLRLDLLKFGGFTDAFLDFSRATADRPGLHLIHGPNEAGKSTARRALRCALFGFPHASAFNFLHDLKDLRVGITIADHNGASHSFVRRKGRSNTLLDAQTNLPVDDDALARCLGGIRGAEEFEHAFAMGHEELRQGGKAMLQEGDPSDRTDGVSQLLFASATGLSHVRELEKQLRETAESLYKPSGQKPAINHALARLKELATRQQSLEVRADDYQALVARRGAASDRFEHLQQQLAAARREQNRLTRLKDALPIRARWRERLATRHELGDVPPLDHEFSKRRATAEREIEVATKSAQLISEQLSQIEEQRAALEIPGDLLAAAPRIERLYTALAIHRKAQTDSDHLQGQVTETERAMRDRLQAIGRDKLTLDPQIDLLKTQDDRRIRALAQNRLNAVERLNQRRQATTRLAERLRRTETEIARLGEEIPLDKLRAAMRAAQRAGNIDGQRAEIEHAFHTARNLQNQGLSSLSLFAGTPTELIELPLPEAATLDQFQQKFDDRDRERDDLGKRKEQLESNRADARLELTSLQSDRDVPDEATLRQARALRDTAWEHVRRALLGQPNDQQLTTFLVEQGGDSLIPVFENATRNADHIADRLRFEADLVSQMARRRAEIAHADLELERLTRDEQQLHDASTTLENRWNTLWQFLPQPPQTPSAMRTWCQTVASLRDQIAQTNQLEQQLEQLTTRRDELRTDLIGQLEQLALLLPNETPAFTSLHDRPLAEALDRAEVLAEQIQATNHRRQTLASDLAEQLDEQTQAEQEVERAAHDLESLSAEWATRMAQLELPADATNEEALAILDTLAEVDNFHRSLADKQQRIAHMKSDRDLFEEEVATLVGELAPDSLHQPSEQTLGELHRRLRAAQDAEKQHEDLLRRRGEALALQEQGHRQMVEWKTQLDLCRKQAGDVDLAALPEIEARVLRASDLDTKIAEARQDLLDRAAGQSLEDFERDLDTLDIDDLPTHIARLEEETARYEEEAQQALAERIQAETDIKTFGGGSDAADLASEAATIRARLVRDVEEFARARLAARLLREARERYRQQSGSALLDSASRLFARLTGGSFSELRIDFGDKDQLVLLGQRPDGARAVEISGMSDGTLDQLYLALRVAWLHAWLDKHEPIPFIVDDLLIHFDDERAAAALEVLSELSERTQVLFFTHHDHLRELAQNHIPPQNHHEHRLS